MRVSNLLSDQVSIPGTCILAQRMILCFLPTLKSSRLLTPIKSLNFSQYSTNLSTWTTFPQTNLLNPSLVCQSSILMKLKLRTNNRRLSRRLRRLSSWANEPSLKSSPLPLPNPHRLLLHHPPLHHRHLNRRNLNRNRNKWKRENWKEKLKRRRMKEERLSMSTLWLLKSRVNLTRLSKSQTRANMLSQLMILLRSKAQ